MTRSETTEPTRVRAALAWAARLAVPAAGIALLLLCMGGTWRTVDAAPSASLAAASEGMPEKSMKKRVSELSGKLNLNTASEDQLMLLPTIGPAKAERVVTWRKKN